MLHSRLGAPRRRGRSVTAQRGCLAPRRLGQGRRPLLLLLRGVGVVRSAVGGNVGAAVLPLDRGRAFDPIDRRPRVVDVRGGRAFRDLRARGLRLWCPRWRPFRTTADRAALTRASTFTSSGLRRGRVRGPWRARLSPTPAALWRRGDGFLRRSANSSSPAIAPAFCVRCCTPACSPRCRAGRRRPSGWM